MRLLPVIEEDLEQYEEEDYEEPSSITSSRFNRDDVNDFCHLGECFVHKFVHPRFMKWISSRLTYYYAMCVYPDKNREVRLSLAMFRNRSTGVSWFLRNCHP